MESLFIVALSFTLVALVPRRYFVDALPAWLRPTCGLPPLLDSLILLAVLGFIAVVAMNPEARILFLAIDAIGFDMFVLLVAMQVRTLAPLLSGLRDWWYDQLWLPGYRLSSRAARELPLVAIYVVAVPVCLASFAACALHGVLVSSF